MPTIETILRQINKDVVPQFEERSRQHLEGQHREWLIEQIVRLTLDAHSLHEMDRRQLQVAKLKGRGKIPRGSRTTNAPTTCCSRSSTGKPTASWWGTASCGR